MSDVSNMTGVTFVDVATDEDEELVFTRENGGRFVFYHSQECCEKVYIEEIIGDLADLVGSPITEAEEISSYEGPIPDGEESYTWTFYKFATAKGFVTVRWLGTSNGYYSESVSLRYEPGRA